MQINNNQFGVQIGGTGHYPFQSPCTPGSDVFSVPLVDRDSSGQTVQEKPKHELSTGPASRSIKRK